MSLYNYLKIHAVLCPLVILAMLQLKEELDSTKELSNNSVRNVMIHNMVKQVLRSDLFSMRIKQF